ncbi:GTPase IMAP family member 7-like [Oopsacas minuta]|uniref:GTPase IMAP family member 7-like n=1 Tax=Oopsacas minuta TaxID=111878 RepID=A0AAV7JAT6_9METZ|nr:GTPase IMAP family member 7-like [Oopsacas minuta]
MATNETLPMDDKEHTLTEKERDFYATVKPETDYNRSIFIVGLSGAGKSQFCNFLTGKDTFKTGGGFMSVTEEPAWCTFEFKNEKVFVIDTPGFGDSCRTENEIFRELCKIGVIASNGSDAVALVINGRGRLDESLEKAMSMLEVLEGSFWEHCFIIFTNEKEMLEMHQVKTGEQYIAETLAYSNYPPILKIMLEKSGNRFMFVESKAKSKNAKYRSEKCNQIFKFIDQIRKETNNEPYINSLMKQGQKYFKQELERIKTDEEPHIKADEETEKKEKESGYVVSKGRMMMNLFSGDKTVGKKSRLSGLDANLATQTATVDDDTIMEYKNGVVTAAHSQSWSEWFSHIKSIALRSKQHSTELASKFMKSPLRPMLK